MFDLFVIDYYRKSFLIAFPGIKFGGGVFLNGSTVQLITHGSLKGSLWNTWIMLDWAIFLD